MVPINYWAVLVAAVANMVLGFLWYGPLFGKPWSVLMGWTPEAMAAMKNDPAAKKKMSMSYTISTVGSLIMAFILAHAIIFASAYLMFYGVLAGIAIGFLNWLGFMAFPTMSPVLWENKPWKLWVINAGYYLVGLCVMGVILAVWK